MDKYKTDEYVRFLNTIAILREPDGCPWDREQTHASLKAAIIEEAAETIGGINVYEETGNAESLKEELGDMLLQIVMQAGIASEEGLFDMEDVARTVNEKMIRRHPHIFGDVKVNNSEEVLANWEVIKKAEKAGKEWMDNGLPKAFDEAELFIEKARKRKKIREISLRPFKNADAAEIVSWFSCEEEVIKWSATNYGHYPVKPEEMTNLYRSKEDCDNFYPMTAFEGDRIIGHCHFVYTDEKRNEARLCFVAVRNDERGKGYGKRMVCAALRYAFEFLDVNAVSLRVFDNNPAARKCYEACGFKERVDNHTTFTFKDYEWGCSEMSCEI